MLLKWLVGSDSAMQKSVLRSIVVRISSITPGQLLELCNPNECATIREFSHKPTNALVALMWPSWRCEHDISIQL